MSGLFALNRRVVEGILFNSRGFKIGLEIVAKGNYDRIVEIPYYFRDRRFGTSKLDSTVMKDYLQHLFLILFAKNSIFIEFLKFSLVGLIGLLLNLAVLYLLVEWFPYWPALGAKVIANKVLIAAIVAFCLAVSSNYLLNRFWTFKKKKAGSYATFIAVSLGGLAINILLLKFLHYRLAMWYMSAQIISICAASLWNFVGSKIWAFKNR
jgi:dolichol-phosphate mannosyltransferase